jgi:hypothetical protein
MSFKPYPALVKWLDAESIDAWTEKDQVDHSLAPIVSIGWVIQQGDESLTIALNHDEKNESFSCMMKIPKGMVLSVQSIKMPKK